MCFHFRVEYLGFVRLAGIHQSPLCLCGILCDHGHVASGIEQFLSGQHAQERHLHGTLYAHFLFFRFDLREFHFVSENPPAQAEFSARDYGLFHKEALLPAAHGAPTDFIARVSHRWIRIKARLLLARLGGANLRLRLPQRGIRFAGDLLHLLERDQRTFRIFLRSSHPRIGRFYRRHFHLMMLFLRGHLHFLRSRDASRCEHARNHHDSEFISHSHAFPLLLRELGVLCALFVKSLSPFLTIHGGARPASQFLPLSFAIELRHIHGPVERGSWSSFPSFPRSNFSAARRFRAFPPLRPFPFP